jgi:hypothetical protein
MLVVPYHQVVEQGGSSGNAFNLYVYSGISRF